MKLSCVLSVCVVAMLGCASAQFAAPVNANRQPVEEHPGVESCTVWRGQTMIAHFVLDQPGTLVEGPCQRSDGEIIARCLTWPSHDGQQQRFLGSDSYSCRLH